MELSNLVTTPFLSTQESQSEASHHFCFPYASLLLCSLIAAMENALLWMMVTFTLPKMGHKHRYHFHAIYRANGSMVFAVLSELLDIKPLFPMWKCTLQTVLQSGIIHWTSSRFEEHSHLLCLVSCVADRRPLCYSIGICGCPTASTVSAQAHISQWDASTPPSLWSNSQLFGWLAQVGC